MSFVFLNRRVHRRTLAAALGLVLPALHATIAFAQQTGGAAPASGAGGALPTDRVGNDSVFLNKFPYLAAPWPIPAP